MRIVSLELPYRILLFHKNAVAPYDQHDIFEDVTKYNEIVTSLMLCFQWNTTIQPSPSC